MKKIWTKPVAIVEKFAANEYVAACWKINCNVPSGYGYTDTNNNGRYDANTDVLLTPADRRGNPDSVRGCGTWHTGVAGVPDDGPVANAMWHAEGQWPWSSDEDYAVFFWRDGDGAHDVHFSKVSDAQWETNPNAS